MSWLKRSKALQKLFILTSTPQKLFSLTRNSLKSFRNSFGKVFRPFSEEIGKTEKFLKSAGQSEKFLTGFGQTEKFLKVLSRLKSSEQSPAIAVTSAL